MAYSRTLQAGALYNSTAFGRIRLAIRCLRTKPNGLLAQLAGRRAAHAVPLSGEYGRHSTSAY
ncbi:hypothetical protein BURKHO8Y_140192 [Burkholderia sp. 8Y]|nr:hypothetical protein BURKHO8Y_140192 [Burkholderia sp. 8Y]